MIGQDDAPFTYEFDDHFRILPQINNWYLDQRRIGLGVKVSDDFEYTSDKNSEWMGIQYLSQWISRNKKLIGTF